MIPLAGPANKQGRIVADNIVSGNKETYDGTMGTSIAKVFDLTVATAGANAKLLKREGIAYQSSYTMEPRMRDITGSRAFIDQDIVRAGRRTTVRGASRRFRRRRQTDRDVSASYPAERYGL